MGVFLHPYKPEASDECIICYGTLKKDALAHGEKNFHKMCKKCAIEWLRKKPVCPGCNVKVMNSSYFRSAKARKFNYMKYAPEAAIAFMGATFALGLIKLYISSSTEKKLDEPGKAIICISTILGIFAGVKASRLSHQEFSAFLVSSVVSLIVINYGELVG